MIKLLFGALLAFGGLLVATSNGMTMWEAEGMIMMIYGLIIIMDRR